MNFKQFLESTGDLRSMILEFMENYPKTEILPYIADWFEDHGDETSKLIRMATEEPSNGFVKIRDKIRKKIKPKVYITNYYNMQGTDNWLYLANFLIGGEFPKGETVYRINKQLSVQSTGNYTLNDFKPTTFDKLPNNILMYCFIIAITSIWHEGDK